MRTMNHFQIDTVKYARHVARDRMNSERMGQLLEAIGSLAPATRAVREAVEDGRVPDELRDTLQAILKTIAEHRAPDTVHRPEPVVDVDQALLDELVELLLKSFHLMRFSNFVIPPGGSPED